MEEFELQLLAEKPLWGRLLSAYLEMAAEATVSPEPQAGPRWCDRIVALDDAELSELTSAHGQLIAMGWLKFQLEDGRNGLVYRVSSEGRRALEKLVSETAGPAVDVSSPRAA